MIAKQLLELFGESTIADYVVRYSVTNVPATLSMAIDLDIKKICECAIFV
jgi:hypothetical protein